MIGPSADPNSLDAQCTAIHNDAMAVVKSRLGSRYDYNIHTLVAVESKIVRLQSR